MVGDLSEFLQAVQIILYTADAEEKGADYCSNTGGYVGMEIGAQGIDGFVAPSFPEASFLASTETDTQRSDHEEHAHCLLCGLPATQAQINSTCQQPALVDLRLTHRRAINQHFLSLRHITLPLAAQKYMALFKNYAEVHL